MIAWRCRSIAGPFWKVSIRIQKVDVGVEIKRVLYDLPGEERDLIDVYRDHRTSLYIGRSAPDLFHLLERCVVLIPPCGGNRNCVRISLESGEAIRVVVHAPRWGVRRLAPPPILSSNERVSNWLWASPRFGSSRRTDGATYERKVNDDGIEIGISFRT